MIHLLDAVGRFSVVALVGAGGKTSAMFRLARDHGEPVFTANSAHLALEQRRLADRFYTIAATEDWPDFAPGVPGGVTLFCGPEIASRARVRGLDEAAFERLRQLAGYLAVPLLIEADGSRGLALKAPAEHEPPIPPFVDAVDAVVVCAGMSALGHPLNEEHVFRAGIFSQISGLEIGQPVNEAALARVMCAPQGGLKNIPPGARRIALLNQADGAELQTRAGRLARLLLSSYSVVVVASLNGPGPGGVAQIHAVHRPTAGIVLAAGGAKRLGMPKQLLVWHGEPLVRRAARNAIAAGLDPVVVVTGAAAVEVEAVLDGLRVVVARCPDWETGQSAALKTGLRKALELRPDLDGATFLLCDQPFVTAEVVRAVNDLRARTLALACAPRVGGRRCNPVLFGKDLFPQLLALEGDTGGRQVLERINLETIEWPDALLGEDINTQADYERLRNSEF
jgi:molybdenum cofactor cytidylyltransferase